MASLTRGTPSTLTSSHPSVPPPSPPSAPLPSRSCPSIACAFCRFVDAPSSVDMEKFNWNIPTRQQAHRNAFCEVLGDLNMSRTLGDRSDGANIRACHLCQLVGVVRVGSAAGTALGSDPGSHRLLIQSNNEERFRPRIGLFKSTCGSRSSRVAGCPKRLSSHTN